MLKQLLKDIEKTDKTTLTRIQEFLYASNLDPEEGVDLNQLPDEIVDILHVIVHNTLPKTQTLDKSVLKDYRSKITRKNKEVAIIRWLRSNQQSTPPPFVASVMKNAQEKQWMMFGPFVARPAKHYGSSVGMGLYTMISLFKGQILCQFTGSLTVKGKGKKGKQQIKTFSNADQQINYIMSINYLGNNIIINPLSQKQQVDHNFAAYINEPSPLPFKKFDVVTVDNRNAVVLEPYDYMAESVFVEYSDNTTEFVDVDRVKFHPLQPKFTHKHRANTMWYDFPVPVKDLYVATGNQQGEHYVYKRTSNTDTVVHFTYEQILSTYQYLSDTTAFFKVTPTSVKKYLQPGTVLVLQEDVYRGLNRSGIVLESPTSKLYYIKHTMIPVMAWALPTTILVGKYHRCVNCAKSDDPYCSKCELLAFPMVCACSDIPAQSELLCLYGEKIASRGVGCKQGLEISEIRPEWSHIG